MQEMQEMPVRSLKKEDPLEEDMATHSSILACRNLGTEEPGRLQSIGLQKKKKDTTERLRMDAQYVYVCVCVCVRVYVHIYICKYICMCLLCAKHCLHWKATYINCIYSPNQYHYNAYILLWIGNKAM